MGALKDLVDLVDNLNEKVTDRRMRDLVRPIMEKVLEIQRALLDDGDQAHESRLKIEDLSAANAILRIDLATRDAEVVRLVAEIEQLKAEIARLQSKSATPRSPNEGRAFDEIVGAYVDPITDCRHCPLCAEPMVRTEKGWRCHCGKEVTDPNRPKSEPDWRRDPRDT